MILRCSISDVALIDAIRFDGMDQHLMPLKFAYDDMKEHCNGKLEGGLLMPMYGDGVILLDSTLSSCYYGVVKGGKVVSTGVIEKSKIIEFVGGREIVMLSEEQNSINLEYNNLKVVKNTTEKLKEIIWDKIQSEEYSVLDPYYLQLSQAERNLKC